MATKRPARGPSAPRVQPDMFGAPPTPAQPFYSTSRDFMFNPGETPTLGGDFNSMYDAARGPQAVAVQGPRGMVAPAGAPAAQAYPVSGQSYQVARPSYPVALDQPGMILNRPAIGNAGPLPMVERLPDPMRTTLGIDIPAAQPRSAYIGVDTPAWAGQGDFFGGGGTVPQGFVADPGNPGQGKFHLQPAPQGALWPELDPRDQPLRQVVAGGNYTPPHDPRAYSNRPMTISRPAAPVGASAGGAGNLLLSGVLAGVSMRDALPANMDPNLADLNMAGGAPIGIEANTSFDTPEEVKYMRALQADRQAREVGGGRGSMPASAYPSGMAAVLGTTAPLPVNSRGQGFNDPRMVQGARAPANSRGQGFVDPRMIRRPAPVVQVVRRAPQPGPWAAMPMDPSVLVQTPVTPSGLPVGNAGIDEATRRRAYAAMGMLP